MDKNGTVMYLRSFPRYNKSGEVHGYITRYEIGGDDVEIVEYRDRFGTPIVEIKCGGELVYNGHPVDAVKRFPNLKEWLREGMPWR